MAEVGNADSQRSLMNRSKNSSNIRLRPTYEENDDQNFHNYFYKGNTGKGSQGKFQIDFI